MVAKEVRQLADKSKIASEEISELSESGQEISKKAGEKLERIIPEIMESVELVRNIVLASKEQQIGVGAINNSIQQLTEITNENSASAEEMSASAEELSAQAEQLKSLISVFKFGKLQTKNEITNLKKGHKNRRFKKPNKQPKIKTGININLSCPKISLQNNS